MGTPVSKLMRKKLACHYTFILIAIRYVERQMKGPDIERRRMLKLMKH